MASVQRRQPNYTARIHDRIATTTRNDVGEGRRTSAFGGDGARGAAALEKERAEERAKARASMDCWDLSREQSKDLVDHPLFDVGIGLVIVLNAIEIGFEQTLRINGHPLLGIQIVESLFLVAYTMELGIRFMAHGTACLQDRFVVLDMFLLVTGILTSWILEPMMAADGQSHGSVAPFMLLRVARLLRLAKTMRLFTRFKEFYMLVRSFQHSASIVFYTFLTLFFILYVFACVGLEVIGGNSLNESDAEFQEVAQKHFGSLPVAMLTLMQFTCWDNMSSVYKPLVDAEPWLALYFVPLVMVVSILLMNLVTAVILSSTFEQNLIEEDTVKRSKESEWTLLISDLKTMFLRLDGDKSGQLSRDEIINIDQADQERLCEALGVQTPIEVFNALDTDCSGQVSICEFFDGIWDVVLAKAPLDLKRMEKQVETMYWRMKVTFDSLHEMHMEVDRTLKQVLELSDRERPRLRAENGDGGEGESNGTRKDMSTKDLSTLKARKPPSKDKDPASGDLLRASPPPAPATDASVWAQDLQKKLESVLEETIRAAVRSVDIPSSLEVATRSRSRPGENGDKAATRGAAAATPRNGINGINGVNGVHKPPTKLPPGPRVASSSPADAKREAARTLQHKQA